MANWDYQKKMDILRIVDCSVTLREKPWRERFEKYRKRWNFRDFWWFFTNSGGCRSGCGLEIWTYIIFGSISMSETQNFKNIGWSHGLQGRKSESTTPRLRGCVLELACRRSDRPGRSRNLGNRKSARMQERRASRCAALSFFLVASIGDATTVRPTPKSPWNRKFEPLKLIQTYVKWDRRVAKNVSNALRNGFGMIWGEAHALTLHFVAFFCYIFWHFQARIFTRRCGFSCGTAYDVFRRWISYGFENLNLWNWFKRTWSERG